MKNTVGEVWKFLDSNPCIKRDLSLGLINQRALAKYILKQKKIDATLDAIISAIRRYELDRESDTYLIIRKLMGQTINLSTRSGLVKVSIVKDDEVHRLLPKLYEDINYSQGEILRVIQATSSIKLLVDESKLEYITDLFPKGKILKITKDIAEINIHMHPKMQTTYGVLGVIANELAVNSINIVEVMSCFPEMLIFVNEENIVKAYQVLYQLCHPKS